MKTFSVTYERWDEAALEAGDTDDRGYIIENVSLRDAVQLGLEARDPSWTGGCEADTAQHQYARTLIFFDWNEGTRERFKTGIVEQRSLHIPEGITPSSRKRIIRLFHTL